MHKSYISRQCTNKSRCIILTTRASVSNLELEPNHTHTNLSTAETRAGIVNIASCAIWDAGQGSKPEARGSDQNRRLLDPDHAVNLPRELGRAFILRAENRVQVCSVMNQALAL